MTSKRATIKRKDGGSDVAGAPAGYSSTPGNFWDIGNYKRFVKRIDDADKLCDEFMTMFRERAEIETKYANRLTQWHEKWYKNIENSTMYATMKNATLGSLKEAADRATIHQDCYGKVHNQVIETLKRWKESHYHKQFTGIKEGKEYEDEFTRAQKQWAAAYGKVHKAKKNYHAACKTLETGESNLEMAKNDQLNEAPPEKIRKLEEVIRKSKATVANMKSKYEEKLARIEPINGIYENDMRKVADKWSREEEKRKDFLQETLVNYHKSVNIVDDKRLQECFSNQIQVAYSGNSKYDVQWWSENFGADMPRNWPRFEEFGERPPTPQTVHAPILENNAGTLPRSGSSSTSMGMSQPVVAAVVDQPVASKPPDDATNPFMNGDDRFDDDDWDEPPPPPVQTDGVPVRALYDYAAVEGDELSFSAGDVLSKLTDEDEQGWCRGRLGTQEGLYPANYVEVI